MKKSIREKNNRKIWNALLLVFQCGITMIVPILMCTLLGVWIGRITQIDWMAIPFFFLGAIAGANSIYRMAKKIMADGDNKDDKDASKIK